LLLFSTKNGPCIVALDFERGIFQRHNRKAVIDGFRDQIPLAVFISRIQNIKCFGRIIQRADASWVNGRDSNKTYKSIAQHKICVVGCGSLGASIARLLVQSGVRDIVLIDGELFESENISRHALGFNYVGIGKAQALADKLAIEFPHIEVRYFNENLKANSKCIIDEVKKSDLIVSCTADWYTDQLLLHLQESEILGPIVFSFVEANACVGHVIVNTEGSEAYNSLHFTSGQDIGKLKNPVSMWPNETLIKIPACAGEFQPYGAIEISHVHAIAAKAVLSLITAEDDETIVPTSYVWVGDTEDMQRLGGNWNPAWSAFGSIGAGNRLFKLRFADNQWMNTSV
jgi:molybdopterin/thiamine biosynthesis adenylyltransferase